MLEQVLQLKMITFPATLNSDYQTVTSLILPRLRLKLTTHPNWRLPINLVVPQVAQLPGVVMKKWRFNCWTSHIIVCIRYVCPHTFEVFEDCIGLFATDRMDAGNLTQLIKDVLVRLSLPLERCRGQCHDDASNMSGRRSGVAARIQQEEPRALYVHCMGYSLNLAVQDTSRSVKVMADTFDTVLEMAKVFKYSAKKKAMLLKLKQTCHLNYGNKATVSYSLDSAS